MELSVGLEAAGVLKQASAARRARRAGATQRSWRGKLGWWLYALALVAVLYVGWVNRRERHWIPEEGFGYWLGIAGAVAMLLLLVYPLRKRYTSLRFLGTVPVWFRLHMALGLLGPSLILLHCNFKSESMNASVALYAMLVVAASGLIGRFLYGHVRSTLNDRRLTAANFFDADHAGCRSELGTRHFQLSRSSLEYATAVTAQALAPQHGLLQAIGHAWLVGWQTRKLARTLRREIATRQSDLIRAGVATRRQLRRARQEFDANVTAHLTAIRKAAGLAVYDRLFALWHFLHLPLFLMLVIAVLVHIVAVHLY